MDINKAAKVSKLLKRKEELEDFFNNIKEFPKIQGITVQVNLIGEGGQLNPCVAYLSPQVVLPCLKEELDSTKRAIKNL